MHKISALIISFAVLLVFFWVIEFLWPAIPSRKTLRRGFFTDVFYWFFTPLVSKSVTQLALLIVLVPILLLLGHSISREAILAGYGPVLSLPVWLQALIILFFGDVISYWTHRWFHGRQLWPFHAIHHSSEELDWLSSVRLHPVNEIVTRLFQAVPFVALGFSPAVIAAYVPFLTFYAIFIHANVNLNFGIFRHVIAGPEFHRWHHTSEEEGLDKNFAGLFPFIDVIFGTFYMPEGRHPTAFGIRNSDIPETLWGQLLHPFRKVTWRKRETNDAPALPLPPISAPEASK